MSYADLLDQKIKKQLPIVSILNELRIFYDKHDQNKFTKMADRISFSELLESQEIQIELYNCLWFELIQNLKKRKIIDQNISGESQLELLKQHKKVFMEAFLSTESEQKPKVRYQLWRNDVRLFDIRKFLSNYLNRKEDEMILFETQNNVFNSSSIQPYKEVLRKNFITLKRRIQESRFYDMVSCLTKFY